MEIEFNPGRYSEPDTSQSIARKNAAQPAGQASFERPQALERALRESPQVRPEKVAHARSLVADVKYPPEAVLNSISNLLALHIARP
jgi:hypothetical protein